MRGEGGGVVAGITAEHTAGVLDVDQPAPEPQRPGQILGRDLIPVLAPLATSKEGITYNVNADTFAGAIAGALGAARLLFLTDVPGVLVRSVFPGREGHPLMSHGSTLVDTTTPFADRWGGWYVTGHHGSARHRGNATLDDFIGALSKASLYFWARPAAISRAASSAWPSPTSRTAPM